MEQAGGQFLTLAAVAYNSSEILMVHARHLTGFGRVPNNESITFQQFFGSWHGGVAHGRRGAINSTTSLAGRGGGSAAGLPVATRAVEMEAMDERIKALEDLVESQKHQIGRLRRSPPPPPPPRLKSAGQKQGRDGADRVPLYTPPWSVKSQ